jgi:hypothetical protein
MDILASIPILTEEELNDPNVKLEDIQRLHHSLTLDNPLTFKIFISKRQDLPEVEKDIYFEIIRRLENNEKLLYERQMKIMKDANYDNNGNNQQEI